MVRDVRVGFLAAGVVDHIPLHDHVYQVPLAVGHVVAQVALLRLDHQVHLKEKLGA